MSGRTARTTSKRVPVSAKIRNQHFDFAARHAPANLLDSAGKDMRTAVGLVIPRFTEVTTA